MMTLSQVPGATSPSCDPILDEARLMRRFAESYRKKFAGMIEALNHTGVSQTQCLRLCVETVDMLLAHQQRLAQLMESMHKTAPRLQAA